MKQDIFDSLKYDILDEVELDAEDKILYSKELRSLLEEEIDKRIKSLPIDRMIRDAVSFHVRKQLKEKNYEKLMSQTENKLEHEVAEAKKETKKELQIMMEEIKKKISHLKDTVFSELGNRYTFGGFSPQFNDLNIGDPSKEGAWRIVKSGDTLSVQYLSTGVWTEAFAFTHNE